MREVTLAVMSYDELSDEAKDAAFDTWEHGEQSMDYHNSGDVEHLIKVIKEETGVRLNSYSFDAFDYNFEVETLFDDIFDLDDESVVGVRAGKKALKMYYELVMKHQVYSKQTKYVVGGLKYGYLDSEYKSLAAAYRRTVFMKQSEAFTGIYNSATFSISLLDSIRKNYTNEDYTVVKHLNHAFAAIFDEAVKDWQYQVSREYFEEHRADDFEYLEDGEIFDLEEMIADSE